MNNKMAINTYLSTIESKKQRKQEQRKNHGYGEWFDGGQMGRGCERMGEEVRGLRSTNRQLHNSHEDVKYSIGNGIANELIRMTHGHEQWWQDCLRDWGAGWRGQRREISTTV